jgi:tripartite-type tricarboxylate transporter receptor subunit TctC
MSFTLKPRRRILSQMLVVCAFTQGVQMAQAADYNGPLKILVGFPPGGATDVVARTLADRLKDVLGQPVIVENKGGAGGMIATQQLKAAPADGSVVMLTIDHTHVMIPLTFKAPGYDPLKDFTPLAGVASYYNVLAVSGTLNVKSLGDFGQWVKVNPAKVSFGVPAAGSVPQFASLIVGKALGVKDPLVVPYKGGAPLVQYLLGGQVPAAFGSLTEYIELHRVGKVQVLAVSGSSRAKAAPEIPTFQEMGLKGVDKNPWLAFVGPKGMPKEFVDRFSKAVATVLSNPDVVERMAKLGNVASYAPPTELQDWISQATQHWGPVIRDSGYELQ